MRCLFIQTWHEEALLSLSSLTWPLQTETRSNESLLVQTHLFHGRKNTEATSETGGKKCFSFLLHTKSIPFYIALVKRAVNDISPGQLLNTVCFTCKHVRAHTQKKLHANRPVPLSYTPPPPPLPHVPFNIPSQVKLFWVALNSATPITHAHITTVLTCSDRNLRRDTGLSQFMRGFFSFYDTGLWLTGDGERVWRLPGRDSNSSWQLCRYGTRV